jgi:hypothetical protein
MAPRDRHVVQEDVTIGMAADERQVGVEQEPAASVRATANRKQRSARRQRGDGSSISVGFITLINVEIAAADGDGRRGVRYPAASPAD